MTYIPTEKVESSNIEEIGYHRQTQTLRIIFQEGRAYDYPLVPEREYNKLMAAESKGRFFNSRIKTLYGHRTVRPEQLKEPCCDHPADAAACSDECYPCDAWCCPGGPSDAVREAITVGLRRGHQIVNSETASEVPPALPRTAEGEIDYEAIPDATAVLKEIEAAACVHNNKEATSDGSIVGCADCGADLSSPNQGTGEPESAEAEARSRALNAADDAAELDGTPTEEREAVIATVCRCCGKSIRIPPEDAVELCGLCFGGKSGDTNEQCTEHLERRDDCPHGADGRDCESSCGCACHAGASD